MLESEAKRIVECEMKRELKRTAKPAAALEAKRVAGRETQCAGELGASHETEREAKREFYDLFARMRCASIPPTPPKGLSPIEAHLLMEIGFMTAGGGTIRPSAIAEAAHSTPSAVSQTLKALERKGFIERIRMREGDSRAVCVSLTDKGRATVRLYSDRFDRRLARLFEYLGDDDAREFLRLLRRVIAFREQEKEAERAGAPSGDASERASAGSDGAARGECER